MFYDSDEEEQEQQPPPAGGQPQASADAAVPRNRSFEALAAFLRRSDLERLAEPLRLFTLEGCHAMCANGRVGLMRSLQREGIALADRQKLANALQRAVRTGELPRMSTAEVMVALAAMDERRDGRVTVPFEVESQSPSPEPSRVPRVIYQTNKTASLGMRAWRNVVSIFERNPDWSYADGGHFISHLAEVYSVSRRGSLMTAGTLPIGTASTTTRAALS